MHLDPELRLAGHPPPLAAHETGSTRPSIAGDDLVGVRPVETALGASSLLASRIVGTTTIAPTMGTDL